MSRFAAVFALGLTLVAAQRPEARKTDAGEFHVAFKVLQDCSRTQVSPGDSRLAVRLARRQTRPRTDSSGSRRVLRAKITLDVTYENGLEQTEILCPLRIRFRL